MATSQKATRKPEAEKKKKPRKVTSKDVPGSGMAKKAAKGIESYRAKQQELLRNL